MSWTLKRRVSKERSYSGKFDKGRLDLGESVHVLGRNKQLNRLEVLHLT